jgi:hypothetical protein
VIEQPVQGTTAPPRMQSQMTLNGAKNTDFINFIENGDQRVFEGVVAGSSFHLALPSTCSAGGDETCQDVIPKLSTAALTLVTQETFLRLVLMNQLASVGRTPRTFGVGKFIGGRAGIENGEVCQVFLIECLEECIFVPPPEDAGCAGLCTLAWAICKLLTIDMGVGFTDDAGHLMGFQPSN